MATGVLFLGGVAGVVLHEESDGARRADRSAPPTTSLAAPSPAPDAGATSTTLGGATTTAPPAGGSDRRPGSVAVGPPATTGPRGTTVPTAAPAARRGSPARPDDEPTLANTGGTSSAPAAFALLGLAAAVHALRPGRGWR